MGSNFFTHPTSVIDEGCIIGEGTAIWHFCHIMPGATIGKGCNIGQNVFIDNNVHIGDKVKIQNNVSLYNGVQIEEEVFIGPSAVFTNVINPRSFIDRKHAFKNTVIKKGVTIGANATIICGTVIGEYAFIGAGAVVTKNVVPHALMTGNPAKQQGWVNEAGETLIFDNEGLATNVSGDKTYRLINGNLVIT